MDRINSIAEASALLPARIIKLNQDDAPDNALKNLALATGYGNPAGCASTSLARSHP